MPSRRVAVTSPQTRLAHARRRVLTAWRPPVLDPSDVQHAMRIYTAQRRRAFLPLILLVLLLLGLPALLAAFPGLDEVRLLGIPVSWLAMATLPYPLMVALAAWQLRRAEQAEDDQA
ncbi:hypothetical protein [Actinokineospora sp. HUAS TT18]|uniref:hypothetical protein n=1 Tax=Actinokineospora sp. HUAS TT18 TaxID=3447451 RepID=UPI003F52420E